MTSVSRGRPPLLDEATIAKAALRMTRSTTFDALSMRSLADELGVGTMTIYNYVANKDALRDLISDHLLRGIDLPPTENGTWDERLRILFADMRVALARHPDLRFGESDEAARIGRSVRSLLGQEGLRPADAELAAVTLRMFLLAQLELAAAAPTIDRDELFAFAFAAVIEAVKQRGAGAPASRRRAR